MSYKYKVYVNDEKEYFEYSYYEGHNWTEESKAKYDCNFTETLLDFLYIDIFAYSENMEEIRKALQRGIYPLENVEENLRIIKKNTEVIADIHPFFKVFELDMLDKLHEFRATENGTNTDKLRSDMIPYKKISHIPVQVKTMQGQIIDLIENVLDVRSPDLPIQKKMAEYYSEDTHLWGFGRSRFEFQPQPTNFEMVDDETFTEVLYPQNIYDIVDFFVRQCVQKDQVFKLCKNCDKYFNVTKYQNTEYCNRIFEEDKTCKDLGAILAYQQKVNENPIIKAYNKSYKTHFAKIRIKKMTKDKFTKWSEIAREMRDRCLAGDITLKEFEAWLKI